MNLLPAIEAYITQRIADLATHHPAPADKIEELEMVRTVCRGLSRQTEYLEKALNHPCKKP